MPTTFHAHNLTPFISSIQPSPHQVKIALGQAVLCSVVAIQHSLLQEIHMFANELDEALLRQTQVLQSFLHYITPPNT